MKSDVSCILVLSLLRESLLAFSHSLICDSSLFMLLLTVVWTFGWVWLSKEWRYPTGVVSSAYIMDLNLLLAQSISLM